MLSVILNWMYITIVCFAFGFAFADFIAKTQDYQVKRLDAIIGMGIVMMTVYAQIFSIFTRVGIVANLIVMLATLVNIIIYGKKIYIYLQEIWNNTSLIRKIVICFMIILFAVFTAKGTMHYDSDLYHAQSIRWIEEYGVVPGLANLHNRFGYNSASFALSALFSMKWLVGKSLHTMSGYFALLLGISVLDISKSFQNKRFAIADYARIAAIFYLTIICDEIVAPASDYPIMCTVFYIIIQWLTLLEGEKETQEKSAVPYALLCMGGAFGVTLKVTAGFILLLAIKPVAQFIKENEVKNVFFYVCLAIFIVAPWLVRNVIISGYLLYPFPAIDLFNFDYKLSVGASRYDANEIKVYGRGIYDATRAGDSLLVWVPYWFKNTLSSLQKIFVLTDFMCVLGVIIYGVVTFVKRKWENLDVLLVLFVLTGSFFFWFEGAPMPRYGYAYVLLMAAVPIGVLIYQIGMKKIVYYPVLLFGIFKLVMLLKYGYQVMPYMNVVWQQEYGKYEMNSYYVGDVEIFYPVEGDRHGYDYFPSTNKYVEVELRGDTIKEGFRIKK